MSDGSNGRIHELLAAVRRRLRLALAAGSHTLVGDAVTTSHGTLVSASVAIQVQ